MMATGINVILVVKGKASDKSKWTEVEKRGNYIAVYSEPKEFWKLLERGASREKQKLETGRREWPGRFGAGGGV